MKDCRGGGGGVGGACAKFHILQGVKDMSTKVFGKHLISHTENLNQENTVSQSSPWCQTHFVRLEKFYWTNNTRTEEPFGPFSGNLMSSTWQLLTELCTVFFFFSTDVISKSLIKGMSCGVFEGRSSYSWLFFLLCSYSKLFWGACGRLKDILSNVQHNVRRATSLFSNSSSAADSWSYCWWRFRANMPFFSQSALEELEKREGARNKMLIVFLFIDSLLSRSCSVGDAS